MYQHIKIQKNRRGCLVEVAMFVLVLALAMLFR